MRKLKVGYHRVQFDADNRQMVTGPIFMSESEATGDCSVEDRIQNRDLPSDVAEVWYYN